MGLCEISFLEETWCRVASGGWDVYWPSMFGFGSGTSRNHAIVHSLLEAPEILNAAL
ncbi:hypothetical protein ACOSQ2_008544 [Xanthoceras sorbifolium]